MRDLSAADPMNRRALLMSAPAALLGSCASTADRRTLEQQVTATEQAFAATMAARDHAAFPSFLADDAVFLNGAFDDVHDAGRGCVGIQHPGDLVEIRAGFPKLGDAGL